MIFMAISALTFAIVLFALWPLVKGQPGRSPLDQARRQFEAARDELARQVAEGAISPEEQQAGEAEQARRLLALQAAEAARAPIAAESLARRKFAALIALIGVPVIALASYFWNGQPNLPDQPLENRLAAREEARRQQANEAGAGIDLAQAIARIEAHLAKNPEDARGFEVIAPIYLREGRFDQAAFAYRRVIELLGPTGERLAALGESLVAAEDGVVTGEARIAFARSLELAPGLEKSRFYLALASEQDGQRENAIAQMTALAQAMTPGPAKARVENELARLKAGEPGAAVPKSPAAQVPPSAETLRNPAILAMVEGLSSRLAAQGGPIEEWLRLIRARAVLGDQAAALAALAAARQAFPADAAAQARLDEAARGLAAASAENEASPRGEAPKQ